MEQDLAAALATLERVILGKPRQLRLCIACLLARGHLLIEDVPGVGKTTLAHALARVFGLGWNRVQFTSDLLPADIVGVSVFDRSTQQFEFRKGPVFTQLLLADELNRTPPKTQAALLEAMQEHTVSYAGTTHALPEPFFVLATQNPIEQAGTYPLPEAQLDRFLLQVKIDYPGEAEERAILAQTTGRSTPAVPAVMNAADVLALRALARDVHVSDDVLAWIARLVRATRPGPDAAAVAKQYVRWGAGPRAGQALVLAGKARALLEGRLAVTREDVRALAAPVLRHRLLLSYVAEAEQRTTDSVVAELLDAVPFTA